MDLLFVEKHMDNALLYDMQWIYDLSYDKMGVGFWQRQIKKMSVDF